MNCYYFFKKIKDFKDTGDYWLEDYESVTFKDDVEQLWEKLKPLYQKLHTYVRAKLRAVYKSEISDDGLIPVHLLGNISISLIKIYEINN